MNQALEASGEPQAVDTQDKRCVLCHRAAPLTRHHLIPKSQHGRERVRTRFNKIQRAQTIAVCRPCHNAIHHYVGEKQLALEYNTLDNLRTHPDIAQFAEWLAGKPDGFKPKRLQRRR